MQYATAVYWTAHLNAHRLSSLVKPTKLRSVPLQFLQKHDFLSHYAAVMFAWSGEMHVMLAAEQQGQAQNMAHRCRKHKNFFDSHQLLTHPHAAAGWCPLCESWAESCPRWWSFSPPPYTLSPGTEYMLKITRYALPCISKSSPRVYVQGFFLSRAQIFSQPHKYDRREPYHWNLGTN